MAEAFGTHFEVTGPVFDGSGLRVMQGIVNRGLLDIATFEGANKVKDDLWGPPAHLYWQSFHPNKPETRHGAHTRDLKRRVSASRPADNLAVVDAGGLSYAAKVERKYHMFEKASRAIERNKAALLDQYIGDALVEAFQ
jgi:hypothetical protein